MRCKEYRQHQCDKIHIPLSLAILIAGCSPGTGPDPGPDPAMVAKLEGLQAEVDVQQTTIARLEDDLATTLEENANLRLKLEDATLAGGGDVKEMDRLRDERDRYRAGLEEAVEQLNKQAQRQAQQEQQNAYVDEYRKRRQQALASPRGATQVRRQTGGGSSYVFPRQPTVQYDGQGKIYASGTIHNAGSQPVAGFLELTLTVGGRILDSATLPMDLPASTVVDYNHEFLSVRDDGAMTVRAEWGAAR